MSRGSDCEALAQVGGGEHDLQKKGQTQACLW